jgi:hypothetical protein
MQKRKEGWEEANSWHAIYPVVLVGLDVQSKVDLVWNPHPKQILQPIANHSMILL